MSAIVKYSNSNTISFSNTTKVLNTSGKYAEDYIRVIDTGMNSSASIYQDNNGYILLSPDSGANPSTEPITINENGTYTAQSGSAYDLIDVSIPANSFVRSIIDRTVTSVELSENITKVGNCAFYGCSNMTTFSAPYATNLGASALEFCTSLTSVYVPRVTTLSSYSVNNVPCVLVFPKLANTTNTSYSFYGFQGSAVDFGENFTAIGANTFSGMGSAPMDTIILRRKISIVTLNNLSGWTGKFVNGTGGKLYVPQALISEYETASNWVTLLAYDNNQILPIEGSAYENYYADGTLIA